MNKRVPTLTIAIACAVSTSACLLNGGTSEVRHYESPVALESVNASPVGAATPSAVSEIDEYCNELTSTWSKESKPDLIFADISISEVPKWREFRSEEDLERFREKSDTFEIANNWLKSERIVISIFTIFSGSGDWVKYVDSCYRDDGSLARAKIEYRTFYGDFVMLNVLHFAADGEKILENKEYRGIKSEMPIEPDEETLQMNTRLEVTDYYKSTESLPFSRLLKK